MFIFSFSSSLPGTPSGLWHYEFIAYLLQRLDKNANKLRACCFKTRMPTNWGVYKNLLVGDWPVLCGRKQAFQGPPRTSQHIAASQSLTVKNSFRGPQSATCGRVGPVTLKTPRTIPWCKRASTEPTESPVWLSAEATSAGQCWAW